MPTEIDGQEYLTAKEAALFFEVSSTTFVDFQKRYHLVSRMIQGKGNRKFFKKEDLVKTLPLLVK